MTKDTVNPSSSDPPALSSIPLDIKRDFSCIKWCHLLVIVVAAVIWANHHLESKSKAIEDQVGFNHLIGNVKIDCVSVSPLLKATRAGSVRLSYKFSFSFDATCSNRCTESESSWVSNHIFCRAIKTIRRRRREGRLEPCYTHSRQVYSAHWLGLYKKVPKTMDMTFNRIMLEN